MTSGNRNHDDVRNWREKIRSRNDEFGSADQIPPQEKDFEDEAEALYSVLKAAIKELSPRAQHWFWLKWIWYQSVCRPYAELDIVEDRIKREHQRKDAGGGMMFAHTHRPYWIRPPEGGDEFDRGERAERLNSPF